MNEIRLLDKDTIDKIAAGEVVERPSSVVKELLENSIDSGASSVSVEIRNGGIDLIRVTDNGAGIPGNQIQKAVLRHCTSKISTAEDLSSVRTLGFRGEALSSICAVSRLEIMTKPAGALMGTIYKAEGGTELSLEDAGLPDGTTVVVRNLFYNVPARLKFLKSPRTEAGYVSEIIEKMALSYPEISFKYTNGGAVKLITPGRGSLKDAVYSVFGREISANLLEAGGSCGSIEIKGYIGKPEIARPARTLENYFINGRYVKDKVVSKAIEDAYSGYQMKGTFPFCCLNISLDPSLVDVNVHPAKLEVKFSDPQEVYESIYALLSPIISRRENIPLFTVKDAAGTTRPSDSRAAEKYTGKTLKRPESPEPFEAKRAEEKIAAQQNIFSDFAASYTVPPEDEKPEQSTIFDNKFVSESAVSKSRIIGQVFGTYWIVEYEDKMYIIDQHAAHEKVLYEKFMKQMEEGRAQSQKIYPGIIVSLSASEEITFNSYREYFEKTGFEAENFGGCEYLISAVPASLYSSVSAKDLFLDTLKDLSQPGGTGKSHVLLDRTASAACKAAVKGNNTMTLKEAQELVQSLLDLENPYNCPHGRPTIITMSKYELEKKFKRII